MGTHTPPAEPVNDKNYHYRVLGVTHGADRTRAAGHNESERAGMPVLVAAGAFLMTLVGGLVAGRVGDKRHLVLGLAAGLMLGVVGFDLLPEALNAAPGKLFGTIAVALASVNVFGGFLVTRRMLEMFKKKEPKKLTADKTAKENA